MKIHQLRYVQYFPVSVDVVWNFIADPANLATITPPEMQFRTLSGDDRKMSAGQIIDYTVSPLLGIRMGWVTEITHVSDREFFVDEQRFGPYAFWHHKHFVEAVDGGTRMEDLVHYKLPLGIFARPLHSLVVRPKLEAIFDFRRKKLAELFGELKTPAS